MRKAEALGEAFGEAEGVERIEAKAEGFQARVDRRWSAATRRPEVVLKGKASNSETEQWPEWH